MRIQVLKGRRQRRAVIAAVVVEPAAEHRIEPPGQIVERLIRAPGQGPPSHRLSHSFRGPGTDSWGEVREVPSKAIFGLSWAKGKPQKVKVILWIGSSPQTVLAVDDVSLLRMDF